MQKPTIYLDSSFLSALNYDGRYAELCVRRDKTREWWEIERTHFHQLTSAFALAELRSGNYRGQEAAIRLAKRIRFLSINGDVKQLWTELLEKRVIPENKPVDAWHLALATVFNVDYLMTWNYSHLANPEVELQLQKLCSGRELRAPHLVSPDTIPQVRFGQVVRRRP